jgi:hypothetical protein
MIIIGAAFGVVLFLACQISYHRGYIDALDWTARQRGHRDGEANHA